MQAYSDPKRSADPYTLPDVEIWRTQVYKVECRCGEYEIPEPTSFEDVRCPSCERVPLSYGGISTEAGTPKLGWFYWNCFPGCLPDSDPFGPFDTEAAALADAQENAQGED